MNYVTRRFNNSEEDHSIRCLLRLPEDGPDDWGAALPLSVDATRLDGVTRGLAVVALERRGYRRASRQR